MIMYMRDGEPVVRSERWLYLAAYTAALGTVVFSLFATPILNWAAQASRAILQLL